MLNTYGFNDTQLNTRAPFWSDDPVPDEYRLQVFADDKTITVLADDKTITVPKDG